MENTNGILKLTVVDGKLTRDTEMMGKMSPYVTLSFNGKKYKTKVHNSGGKSPVWGDEFTLEITNATEELVLRTWDQDLTTSDAVGFVKIKISSLIFNEGVDDWFTIMFENQTAGEIHLTTQFEPEGGSRYDQMKEALEDQNARLEQEAAEAKEALEKLEAHKEKIEADLAAQEEKMAAEKAEMEAKLAEAEASGSAAEDELA